MIQESGHRMDLCHIAEVLDIGSRLHPLWTRWGPRLCSSRQGTTVRPCIARATRARAHYSNSSRPTMKPSRPCCEERFERRYVSGRGAGIVPWPPTSIADFLNPAFALRASARTRRSFAEAAGFAVVRCPVCKAEFHPTRRPTSIDGYPLRTRYRCVSGLGYRLRCLPFGMASWLSSLATRPDQF